MALRAIFKSAAKMEDKQRLAIPKGIHFNKNGIEYLRTLHLSELDIPDDKCALLTLSSFFLRPWFVLVEVC